jgi:DNA primase
MIPIRDVSGQVIAFGGRELPQSEELTSPKIKSSKKNAKYVNSPNSAGTMKPFFFFYFPFSSSMEEK